MFSAYVGGCAAGIRFTQEFCVSCRETYWHLAAPHDAVAQEWEDPRALRAPKKLGVQNHFVLVYIL